jgi:hypothetical protein
MIKSDSIVSKNLSLVMKNLSQFVVGNLPSPLFSEEGNSSLWKSEVRRDLR